MFNILVVEDDINLCSLIGDILRDERFVPFLAQNAKEAQNF